MKITLYMATSVDGCITRGLTDSDWVSENDWDEFYKHIKTSDAVIMGRRTMEQFPEDEFPIEGAYNIVLTTNKNLHTETDNLKIFEASPNQVVDFAIQKGFQNLLLIGGEVTNGIFLKANLINEVVLSVHPLIIGEGLSLFGRYDYNKQLKLADVKKIKDELVQLKYTILI